MNQSLMIRAYGKSDALPWRGLVGLAAGTTQPSLNIASVEPGLRNGPVGDSSWHVHSPLPHALDQSQISHVWVSRQWPLLTVLWGAGWESV